MPLINRISQLYPNPLRFFLLAGCFILLPGFGIGPGQGQNAFQPGEILEYDISYGFIKGGHASLKVVEKENNGSSLWNLVLKGKTTGLTDRIYRVEDIYESYIVPSTGLPVRSIRNIREQNYRHYEEVIHNQEHDYVITTKSGKVAVPNNTLDVVSAFYFLRNQLQTTELKPEMILRFTTYFGGDLFPLVLRYKKTEWVKTRFGKIACHKFMPVTEVGRVFKTEDDMTIWLSADRNFLPVKINFQLIVGSVNCELVKYKNNVYPLVFK
jgi:hypothetical protein